LSKEVATIERATWSLAARPGAGTVFSLKKIDDCRLRMNAQPFTSSRRESARCLVRARRTTSASR